MPTPIIDSALGHDDAVRWNGDFLDDLPVTWTGEQRSAATQAVLAAARRQVVLEVSYLSTDQAAHRGQIVVDRLLESSLCAIFDRLLTLRFPIHAVIPIVGFGFDDGRSMAFNNSSGFNPRLTSGENKRLSNHTLGLAVDINPLNNPYVSNPSAERGTWICDPAESVYDVTAPLTITPQIADVFKQNGFDWGGDWNQVKDYHHFDFDTARCVDDLRRQAILSPTCQLSEDIQYLTAVTQLRVQAVLSR